jgi:hypothetical protein
MYHPRMIKDRRLSVLALAGMTAVAVADGKPDAKDAKPALPALVGAIEVVKITPPTGFIDDPVALEAQRFAYVVSDTTDKAELHVTTFEPRSDIVIDLTPVTVHPIAVELVGDRAFVVGMVEEGKQIAALVELGAKGKKPGAVAYKLGPATHITVVERDGKPRAVLHRSTQIAERTRHEAELYALDTGKRIAAGPPLELDGKNANAKLEFRVNHWADGMSRAYGLRGGEWDPKENQRTPDAEIMYDLTTGKFSDRHAITDLFEQHKRYQILADAGGRLEFVHMTWDNAAVQIWHQGKSRAVELDQPIQNYDPKSLQGKVLADGTAWFALETDPVNPDAVARKKADPPYLDVFHAGSDGKAVRKARVLAPGTHHRFGVAGDRFWLVEKSPSFDRGGKSVAVYTLAGS